MQFGSTRQVRFLIAGAAVSLALAAGGCTSIRENRGYIVDNTLTSAVQPGLDNRKSVETMLGRPTFISQYGETTWYYVSSVTGRKPFVNPRIREHQVLAVKFDPAGNVATAQSTGMDLVVKLSPDGDKTPTLGRERGFFEDLFGNIGAVGAAGAVPGAGGPGGP